MENTTKENKEELLNFIKDKWMRKQLEDMLDELSFRNGFDIFKEEEKIGWIDVKDNGDIRIKGITEYKYKPLIEAFVAINASYIRETLDKRLGKYTEETEQADELKEEYSTKNESNVPINEGMTFEARYIDSILHPKPEVTKEVELFILLDIDRIYVDTFRSREEILEYLLRYEDYSIETKKIILKEKE